MNKFGHKILNFIKQAYHYFGDDSNQIPIAKYKTARDEGNYVPLPVYGICSNPPKDSHILLINSQGRESTPFGIVNDFFNRKKGLKEGEFCLLNTLTGSITYFKENGDIDFEAPNINITGDVNIDGDLNCTGTATIDTDVVVGPNLISFLQHFHLGNLAYNTGVPVVGAGTPKPAGAPSGDASGNIDMNGKTILGIGSSTIDYADHDHDYSWTDPAGSGTTDPPNN